MSDARIVGFKLDHFVVACVYIYRSRVGCLLVSLLAFVPVCLFVFSLVICLSICLLLVFCWVFLFFVFCFFGNSALSSK